MIAAHQRRGAHILVQQPQAGGGASRVHGGPSARHDGEIERLRRRGGGEHGLPVLVEGGRLRVHRGAGRGCSACTVEAAQSATPNPELALMWLPESHCMARTDELKCGPFCIGLGNSIGSNWRGDIYHLDACHCQAA